MKNLFYGIALLVLAGCSSYSEIARWDSPVAINDGEVPVASFVTQNFSYQLLGFIPLGSGLPWTDGEDDICDEFNIAMFTDRATLDNNLVSLNHALDRAGSHRITQLRTFVSDDSTWSLFLVNRHEVRTSCIILKEK